MCGIGRKLGSWYFFYNIFIFIQKNFIKSGQNYNFCNFIAILLQKLQKNG